MDKEIYNLNNICEQFADNQLNLYIVGGYAMQLYGLRETHNDIDAYWERNGTNDLIIDTFNKLYDLEINDEVRLARDLAFRFNPEVYKSYKSFNNLNVFIPNEDYLLLMKVVSASIGQHPDKHIKDIISLSKDLGIDYDFNKIYDIFKKYSIDSYGIKPIIDYLNDNR